MKTFMIVAVTADGFIAREAGHNSDWTSQEDKKFFVEMTKRARVMIMGSTTFKTIGRALPGRQTIVYSRSMEPVEGVEVTQESPADLLARLEEAGYDEVAIVGGSKIYSLFMDAGLVDELYLTIEPVLFGSGITMFDSPTDTQLKLIEYKPLNEQSLMLHYEVLHGRAH